MRGGALSDPAVVGSLSRFIVTYWYGHRDSPNKPDVVEDELANRVPNSERPHRGGDESNVFLLVIDSQGHLVHAFDGFPKQGRAGKSLTSHVLRELDLAKERLGLEDDAAPSREISLPDLAPGQRGVRVITRLLEDRMTNYRVPVVESVPLDDEVWDALRLPPATRTLPASTLKAALSTIYPPGVMERVSKTTYRVYAIDEVLGDLTLEPAGSDGKLRYAILSGKVTLGDEGDDDFSYTGSLGIVLAYSLDSDQVVWMRGAFDANYPRYDPKGGYDGDKPGTRIIPLVAAIESRP